MGNQIKPKVTDKFTATFTHVVVKDCAKLLELYFFIVLPLWKYIRSILCDDFSPFMCYKFQGRNWD